MGDVIQFQKSGSKFNIRNTSFIRWFKNLFHVHEWIDDQVIPLRNSLGEDLGGIFIQKCRTCNLRSSQKVTSEGMTKRKLK